MFRFHGLIFRLQISKNFWCREKLPRVACFELGYNKTLTHRTQFFCKFVKIRIVLQFWRLGGHRFRLSKELSVADILCSYPFSNSHKTSVVDLTLDSLDLGKCFTRYWLVDELGVVWMVGQHHSAFIEAHRRSSSSEIR